MGKSSPSPPPAPDPVVTANAQSAANIDTARAQANMNRVNQVGPFGNLTYSQDDRGQQWIDQQVAAERAAYKPSSIWDNSTFDENAARSRLASQNPYQDAWTATTTLSPEEQRKYDQTNEATDIYGQAAISQLRKAQESLSQPFNPDIPNRGNQIRTDYQTNLDFSGIGDPNQSRDAVANALYARLNPGLQQARAGLENQLRNQGISPGSEAWTNAIRDATQRETDARLGVETQAGQEQSRVYGLAQDVGNFHNQGIGQINQAVGQQGNLDQSYLQQLLAVRGQPINEASALLNGSQLNLPQFTQVPQTSVGQTDVLGAYGQQQGAQQNAYNANLQTANANRTGMYTTAAAAVTAAAAIA